LLAPLFLGLITRLAQPRNILLELRDLLGVHRLPCSGCLPLRLSIDRRK
jgi:hypothetical protein